MGQTHSQAADSRTRTRDRSRPSSWATSWAPSPSPPASTLSPSLPGSDVRSNSFSSRSLLPSASSRPLSQLTTHHEYPDDAAPEPSSGVALARRRSRMSRARSSLSSLPNLFHRRMSSRSRDADPSYESSSSSSSLSFPANSHTPLRHSPSAPYERRPFLPRVRVPDLNVNFDELPDEARPPRPHNHSDYAPWRDGRVSSMLPSFRPDRRLRSISSSLRRRRSPQQREEDQAAVLSRLLSMAAVATAASLMGSDHRAVAEARNVAPDSEDGTFDSFLQALQSGRIASALRQTGNESDEGLDSPGAQPPPLNFFRMFRFGSSAGDRSDDIRSNSRNSPNGSSGNRNGDEEEGDGRMVPIIIVGIRSITPGTGSIQDENIPPFLDALSSFPGPPASPGDSTVDGILRQPQQRFSHRRRASMGGVNTLSSNYDNQRHYRSPERPRPWSTLTDSPAGPLPPPSTPASSGLSAISSGTNTPALSTSPPSPIVQSTASSRRGSFVRRANGSSNLEPTVEEPRVQPRIPRQRRMSESDFTRFGSGASRRNGVVEPDHNPGEGSRSWIIYVLGGSYPENHPILTTPSLFTDSPTYEDMLLLSSLLGPAKPPVASEEDVAAAPGLFKILKLDSNPAFPSTTTIAVAVEGTDSFTLAADARCLVCLCDFETDEEARRLVNCGHLFHRICIDQWLTTGRNSCPLCRGQGVDETSDDAQPTTPPELMDPTPDDQIAAINTA